MVWTVILNPNQDYGTPLSVFQSRLYRSALNLFLTVHTMEIFPYFSKSRLEKGLYSQLWTQRISFLQGSVLQRILQQIVNVAQF